VDDSSLLTEDNAVMIFRREKELIDLQIRTDATVKNKVKTKKRKESKQSVDESPLWNEEKAVVMFQKEKHQIDLESGEYPKSLLPKADDDTSILSSYLVDVIEIVNDSESDLTDVESSKHSMITLYKDRKSRRRRRGLLCGCFVFLVVSAFVIGLTIGLSKHSPLEVEKNVQSGDDRNAGTTTILVESGDVGSGLYAPQDFVLSSCHPNCT
jgi:hypothetical protein